MKCQSNLMPLREMARRLRVPATWLKAEALAGRVPAVQAGNQFLFHLEAVESALAERARKGGPRHDR